MMMYADTYGIIARYSALNAHTRTIEVKGAGNLTAVVCNQQIEPSRRTDLSRLHLTNTVL